MPPERNLAWQVKQPHQLARLRVVSLLLEHLDRRLAHDCGQFVSDSCEFASGASMRRSAILCAPFGCSVLDLGFVGSYRAASVIEYMYSVIQLVL
jgi:hypothetical protein